MIFTFSNFKTAENNDFLQSTHKHNLLQWRKIANWPNRPVFKEMIYNFGGGLVLFLWKFDNISLTKRDILNLIAYSWKSIARSTFS